MRWILTFSSLRFAEGFCVPSGSPCVAGVGRSEGANEAVVEMQHKADPSGIPVLPQNKLLGMSYLLLRDSVIQKKGHKENAKTPTRVLLSGQSCSLASE